MSRDVKERNCSGLLSVMSDLLGNKADFNVGYLWRKFKRVGLSTCQRLSGVELSASEKRC